MSQSVLNKLADVTVENQEFTNVETGELVEYKEIHLHVEFDGQPETITAKIAKNEGKAAYRLLQLADDQK